jgi:aspartyl-tRNA(Asn)/glutamyl-tRNA(Gln) amidotransferase subunit C
MSLEPIEIRKIAYLSRLDILDKDIPTYSRNLSDILKLVEQMNAVDTAGVVPMAHPLNMPQRLRADEIGEISEPINREYLQASAPQVESGLYLVPKVIDY